MSDSGAFVPVLVVPPHTERFSKLTTLFRDKLGGHKPDFFVRVPGRVNLIGEHVDYCGYPVLPMALEQDVLLAVKGIEDPILRIVNRNIAYRDYEGHITTLRRVEGSRPEWYEYIICGIKGAAQVAFPNGVPRGLLLAVCGTIPPAAGLSSSSALVCAAALALLHDNKVKLSKMEMALLCARSERLIGTEGGGMDQAIAFLAQDGCASYISWNPLNSNPVNLPRDAVFVVAHSLVEANKAATQDFNDRVKECTIAAQTIARSQGLNEESKNSRLTLSKVQCLLNVDLYKMKELVSMLPQKVGRLKIKDRATHVIEEAIRVEQFRNVCENMDDCKNWREVLGNYMKLSHKSLSQLYECSHPILDELIQLSDDFGVHARVTGAGWGGCIVALCHYNEAVAYVEMLKNNFYSKHSDIRNRNINDLVFITSPRQGAFIYSTN